jgi:hypothetical protein
MNQFSENWNFTDVLEEASREALATTVQKDDERDGAQPLVRFPLLSVWLSAARITGGCARRGEGCS